MIEQKDARKKLKLSIHENLHSISVHGIVNIIRSEYSISKLLWFILTIVSTGFGSYFALLSILDYFQYDVTTYVRLMTVNQLDFPTITICNRNQFSTIESIKYIKENIEMASKNSISDYDSAEELFSNINLYERKNMTLSIDEMLLSCKFNQKDCNKNDFVWIFNRHYGNCYRYNSKINDSKSITRAVSKYGLMLDLYLGLPEELKNYSLKLNQKSILVSLTEKSVNPYRSFTNLIELPTGVDSYIQVEKTLFEQEPRPYSNCSEPTSDLIYYEQLTRAGYLYSQLICVDFCLANFSLAECNCIILKSSINFANKTYCKLNTSEYNCSYNIFLRESKYALFCHEICPIECKREKYSYLETNTKLNTKILSDKQNNMIKYYAEDDLLRLKINYASLNYIYFKEKPSMNFFNLLSNFGGTLGLFLGNKYLLKNSSILWYFIIFFK